MKTSSSAYSQRALQLRYLFSSKRATDNIARYLKRERPVLLYPITSGHLRHWERFWEPVILTLLDSNSGVTYWECIQTFCESLDRRLHPDQSLKTLRVQMPTDNMLNDEGLARIESRTRSRFERFTREQDGAAALLEMLEAELGLKVQYAPQPGILLIPKGRFTRDKRGGTHVALFGQAAAHVEWFKKHFGLTPDQVFHGGIDTLKQVLDAFASGGKLEIRDSNGKVVESWDTWEALKRHIDRWSELKE